MAKPANPRYGFGNPKAEACGEVITGEHATTGLILQLGIYSGLAAKCSFSDVNTPAAISPIIPPIVNTHGKTCLMMVL